jgi:hypothetical protein
MAAKFLLFIEQSVAVGVAVVIPPVHVERAIGS